MAYAMGHHLTASSGAIFAAHAMGDHLVAFSGAIFVAYAKGHQLASSATKHPPENFVHVFQIPLEVKDAGDGAGG